MIVTSLQEFSASLKKELPKTILILGADPLFYEQAMTYIQKQFSDYRRVQCKDGRLIVERASQPSFFQEAQLLCITGIDSMKEREQKHIAEQFSRLDVSTRVVLIGESLKPTSPLFEKADLVFQPAKVPPWEKEGRLAEWVQDYFQKAGVRCEPKVAHVLAKASSLDSNELDKIIAYVGDTKQVEEKDIAAITSVSQEHTLWQLSDALMQANGQELFSALASIQKQEVFALIIVRHLRSCIHQLLEITSRIQAGQAYQKIAEHFPKLKGRLFEKAYTNAQNVGHAKLQDALIAIDTAEYGLKESATDEETLVETLVARLRYILCST